jgi:hypothetical protein
VRARWHQAAHVAACLPPARPAPDRGNTRRGELLGDPGRGSGRLASDGRVWSGGSAAAAHMARWRTVLAHGHGVLTRGGRLWRFIGEVPRLEARRDRGGGPDRGSSTVRGAGSAGRVSGNGPAVTSARRGASAGFRGGSGRVRPGEGTRVPREGAPAGPGR